MAISSGTKVALISGAAILMFIYFAKEQISTLESNMAELKEIVFHEPKENIAPVPRQEDDEMQFEHIENNGRSPPGSANPQEEFDRMWDYVYHMQYQCKEREYLGGKPQVLRDGAYSVCTEDRFWPVKRNPQHKCLMYSIGVGWGTGDFTFDDEIAKRGCEVHSFDPVTKLDDGTIRESGVVFHKVGIYSEDIDKNPDGWKLRTLKTLLKELGHQGRYLDYLKIDTDAPQGGFEDTLMQELLDTGMHSCVRQYAMEIHLRGPVSKPDKLARCRALYRQMATLNDFGWRLYNTTDNVREIQIREKKPNFRNTNIRPGMVNGVSAILWETAFVNFNVKQPCIPTSNGR